MEESLHSQKSGYLNRNFRLFHLKDKRRQEYELHYHEFNKVFIFLSGNVTYTIEGKNYHLKPWDILLVNNRDLHRPLIDPNAVYERMVLYIRSGYMQSGSCDIQSCFTTASQSGYHLIRPSGACLPLIQQVVFQLEASLKSSEAFSELLSDSYFLQLMVFLNRIFAATNYSQHKLHLNYDRRTESILQYINQHLGNDLSNEFLAEHFFLSKYYLMHSFKKETGYTLHTYIQQKRLMKASSLIKEGTPVMKAAQQCGFKDYSTFYRAFIKFTGRSPKDILD